MSLTRRFLIAPSLARLVRRECGGSRVSEGYFANQSGRSSSVRVEGDIGSLVLVDTTAEGAPLEERTEVPQAHAAALLDVAPGKISYARTRLKVDSREVWIDRFVTPGVLDLVLVEFDTAEQASSFSPLAWFGPEVTKDAVYQSRSLALDGMPQVPTVSMTNGALDALLDSLDSRFGATRAVPAAERPDRVGALNQFASAFSRAVPAPQGDANASAGEGAPMDASPSPTDDESQDRVIRELARSLGPQRRAGR